MDNTWVIVGDTKFLLYFELVFPSGCNFVRILKVCHYKKLENPECRCALVTFLDLGQETLMFYLANDQIALKPFKSYVSSLLYCEGS